MDWRVTSGGIRRRVPVIGAEVTELSHERGRVEKSIGGSLLKEPLPPPAVVEPTAGKAGKKG